MSELDKQNQKNMYLLNEKIENFSDVNNIKHKNFSILSMLRDNKHRLSLKTTDTFSFIQLKDYEINKFDELNDSLSNISNFDLEEEEENNSSSFNSSEDNDEDDDSENLEVIKKKSKIKYDCKDKNEYEIKLDKELEEIKRELLKGKN